MAAAAGVSGWALARWPAHPYTCLRHLSKGEGKLSLRARVSNRVGVDGGRSPLVPWWPPWCRMMLANMRRSLAQLGKSWPTNGQQLRHMVANVGGCVANIGLHLAPPESLWPMRGKCRRASLAKTNTKWVESKLRLVDAASDIGRAQPTFGEHHELSSRSHDTFG